MNLERDQIKDAVKRHLSKGVGFNQGDFNIFRAYETTQNVVIHNIAEKLGINTLELTGQTIENFLKNDQDPVAQEQRRMLGVSTTGLTLSEAICIAKQAYYHWSEIAVDLEQRRRMSRGGVK